MAKTMSMTRSQDHDDAPNMKIKTCDNGGEASWSDLNQDVLFLVMMHLGFVDYFGFSRVCKSWRSLAVSKKKTFIASRPPMDMSINYGDKGELYLKDYEGRELKTVFPYSVGRNCVGITCGYLILFGWRTQDFWLVNPITRHELYFPHAPSFIADCLQKGDGGVLVFSHSISEWVFVMASRFSHSIWYSIPGTGAWNYVYSTFPILDLHYFKGKIFTLHNDGQVCVMTLYPDLELTSLEPELTSLEIENGLEPHYILPKFISAGEKLYVVDRIQQYVYTVNQELDFGKMKWVLPEEKTIGEYAFFLSILPNFAPMNCAAVKLELQAADPQSQYKLYRISHTAENSQRGCTFFATVNMWYFLHECMNVSYIDE